MPNSHRHSIWPSRSVVDSPLKRDAFSVNETLRHFYPGTHAPVSPCQRPTAGPVTSGRRPLPGISHHQAAAWVLPCPAGSGAGAGPGAGPEQKAAAVRRNQPILAIASAVAAGVLLLPAASAGTQAVRHAPATTQPGSDTRSGTAGSAARAKAAGMGDAVTYQIDPRHDGDQAVGRLSTRSLKRRWKVTLGKVGSDGTEAGDVSYPVIADNRGLRHRRKPPGVRYQAVRAECAYRGRRMVSEPGQSFRLLGSGL